MGTAILEKLESIERYAMLQAKNVLNIADVSLLTGLSEDCIHRKVSARQIPCYRPNGKHLYFDKAEIEDWLRRGKIFTQEEVLQNAAAHELMRR